MNFLNDLPEIFEETPTSHNSSQPSTSFQNPTTGRDILNEIFDDETPNSPTSTSYPSTTQDILDPLKDEEYVKKMKGCVYNSEKIDQHLVTMIEYLGNFLCAGGKNMNFLSSFMSPTHIQSGDVATSERISEEFRDTLRKMTETQHKVTENNGFETKTNQDENLSARKNDFLKKIKDITQKLEALDKKPSTVDRFVSEMLCENDTLDEMDTQQLKDKVRTEGDFLDTLLYSGDGDTYEVGEAVKMAYMTKEGQISQAHTTNKRGRGRGKGCGEGVNKKTKRFCINGIGTMGNTTSMRLLKTMQTIAHLNNREKTFITNVSKIIEYTIDSRQTIPFFTTMLSLEYQLRKHMLVLANVLNMPDMDKVEIKAGNLGVDDLLYICTIFIEKSRKNFYKKLNQIKI